MNPAGSSLQTPAPSTSPSPECGKNEDKDASFVDKDKSDRGDKDKERAKKRRMPIINPLVSLPMWPSPLISFSFPFFFIDP